MISWEFSQSWSKKVFSIKCLYIFQEDSSTSKSGFEIIDRK
ncbi:Uncharacterised protein [Serratia fonticola]|nr:Uncharacterised protein [Serratia fonticola]CAI1191504.1 Uncharacterised protein [Serratia fonticola]